MIRWGRKWDLLGRGKGFRARLVTVPSRLEGILAKESSMPCIGI